MAGGHQEESLYQLPSYSYSAAQGVCLRGLVGIGLDLAVSAHAAASVLAWRWGWSPVLGRAWLRFPVYPQGRLLAAAVAMTGALAMSWVLAVARRSGGENVRRRSGGGAVWAGRLVGALPLGVPALVGLYLAALLPVYPTLAMSRWSARFGAVPELAGAVGVARRGLVAGVAGLAAVTLAATVARLAALRETGDTHGSSHWASAGEVAATGLLDAEARAAGGGEAWRWRRRRASRTAAERPAVVVGAWEGRAPGEVRRRRHALRDRRDRHVLAFAPSGSGKSTCLVVPTLLTWTGSVVVLDIKGELWHLTSGYRREALGQRCLRLDLADASGGAAAYNPLLVIPRGPGDVKHAQSVADVLVDPDGRDRERSFWEQSAHALLTALILHVVYAEGKEKDDGGGRTLAACGRLLSDPGRPLVETLEALLVEHHDPRLTQGWRDARTGAATYTHPVVAAAVRSLLDMDPRTSSGIVATAQAHLALFRDPVLAMNTARSDFAPLELVSGERPVSLYLTLAPAELERLRGPIRMVLNQMCRVLTERMDFAAGGEGGGMTGGHLGGRRPLLLMLDEFTALGKLDFFGRAMAYLRGYGIRVYLSIQSLSQLHETYGPHQSITANCPVQVAFAPADLETAELLSRLLGPRTVHVARRSLNGAPLVLGPRRHTLSVQELARPLLTAEEVRRLPDREAIVLVAGHAPIRGRRVGYFEDAGMGGAVSTGEAAGVGSGHILRQWRLSAHRLKRIGR